jgi:hypothetical protein
MMKVTTQYHQLIPIVWVLAPLIVRLHQIVVIMVPIVLVIAYEAPVVDYCRFGGLPFDDDDDDELLSLLSPTPPLDGFGVGGDTKRN